MRPIKLTMQAFGPYAETQTLDMGALGETGIYAITGETGAGKTTIFDAIVYALYGSASGEDRGDGRGLRSVAARPDLETKVSLEFVSGGKTYAIERKPAQALAGKRKRELVEKPAGQVLTMPDGRRYTRDREIAELVERDILGVNRDQFCQIVMIAQGEFRKLLRADTKQRTEILRRIFKTERYNAISRRMDKLCKAQYIAMIDSRKQVSFSLNLLRVEPQAPMYGALEEMKRADPNALALEEAAQLAVRICEADGAEYREAHARLKRAEAERDEARQALERAAAQAQKRERLAALRDARARQGEGLAEAERQRTAAEAEKPRIDRLAGEIALESSMLPKYAALAGRVAKANEIEAALAGAAGEQAAAERGASKLKDERAAMAAEAQGLGDAPERKLNAANALNEARVTGERLERLYKRLVERGDAEAALREKAEHMRAAEAAEKAAEDDLKALVDAQEALGNTELALTQLENAQRALTDRAGEIQGLKKLYGDYLDARARYAGEARRYAQREAQSRAAQSEAERLRDRFNANIAGIWASALEEGRPCPVCGSTHHPRLAEVVDQAVSEEAVKAAEQRALEAREAYNAQAVACSERKKDCDHCRGQLAERLPGLSEDAWASGIERQAAQIAGALRGGEADIEAARRADAHSRKLRDIDVPAARRAWEDAAGAKNRAQADLRAAEVRLDGARRELAAAARGVMPEGFSELDLSDAMAENRRQREALNGAVEQARRDMERLEEINGRQRRIAEELDGAAEAIKAAENRVSGLSAELEARRRDIDALKRELPHPTEAECRASIDGKAARKSALEAAVESAGRAVAELKAQIAGTDGQIDSLAAELKDAPPADPEALKADYDAKAEAYRATADREKAVFTRRDSNAKRQRELVAQAETARGLEREYRVMKDVSDTANGDVTGEDKVTLEAYVQRAYFDRIIGYANRRLIHMSRQQYDLARQSAGDGGKRSKTGLELDVVDHANGQRRAVGTLSGGESFLAALSFALGMSDAIQASATSAVQLDTMFVDEGFGSLSENFLNLVMDELNDTANAGRRLIGVISHVDEVKDGVDRRIEVTKSASGVSRAEIR